MLKLIKFVMLCLYAFPCLAQISVSNTQDINLGKMLLSKQDVSATLSVASELSVNGAYVLNSNVSNAGIINFTSAEDMPVNINLDTVNAVVSLDSGSSCSINVSNVVTSENVVTLNNDTASKDVSVGLTLNINGYCAAKIYNGTVTIPYTVTDENNSEVNITKPPASLNLTLEIEEPLSMNKKSDLNFGSIISPQQDGTVVISPDGNLTLNNIYKPSKNDISSAVVEVSGVNGRTVNLEMEKDSITLKNDAEDTMVVDTFVFSTDKVFVLKGEGAEVSQDVYIGATLHVSKNQPQGEYSGSFTFNVFY